MITKNKYIEFVKNVQNVNELVVVSLEEIINMWCIGAVYANVYNRCINCPTICRVVFTRGLYYKKVDGDYNY